MRSNEQDHRTGDPGLKNVQPLLESIFPRMPILRVSKHISPKGTRRMHLHRPHLSPDACHNMPGKIPEFTSSSRRPSFASSTRPGLRCMSRISTPTVRPLAVSKVSYGGPTSRTARLVLVTGADTPPRAVSTCNNGKITPSRTSSASYFLGTKMVLCVYALLLCFHICLLASH